MSSASRGSIRSLGLAGHAGRLLCCLVLLAGCMVEVGAQDTPAAPADPWGASLNAADEAARGLDYEKALEHLGKAAELATGDIASRIKARQVLYERFLGMSALIETARENPGKLVGQGSTRGGRQFLGLIRLLEIGVYPTARIGNRVPDRGTLAVRLDAERTRLVKGSQIAMVALTWRPPAETGWPKYWGLEKLRIVLHTGEVVEGTWDGLLPVSSLSFREPDKDEDTTIDAYPSMVGEFSPDDLVRQVVILGAPQVPATEEPSEETP